MRPSPKVSAKAANMITNRDKPIRGLKKDGISNFNICQDRSSRMERTILGLASRLLKILWGLLINDLHGKLNSWPSNIFEQASIT